MDSKSLDGRSRAATSTAMVIRGMHGEDMVQEFFGSINAAGAAGIHLQSTRKILGPAFA